tara:strand:- start:3767 stop:4336 length:570 start_codon:yes stop_codon:yes gene_type:complete
MLKNYTSLLVQDRHGNIDLNFPNDIFLFYCLVSILVSTTLMVVAAAAFSGYNLQLIVLHFDIILILILVLFILSVLRPWLVLLISLTEQMASIEVAVAKNIHLPEKRGATDKTQHHMAPRTRQTPKNVANAYNNQRSYANIKASQALQIESTKKDDPPQNNSKNDDMVTISIDEDKLNQLFNRGQAFNH